jgi:hypothetical protein
LLNISKGVIDMNLYERLRELAVRFDVLNMDYEELNKSLREVVLEARIEKDRNSREYKKFKSHVVNIRNHRR